MLPRYVALGHSKPGVPPPGLHAPHVVPGHLFLRGPCTPYHAAATDVAPAAADDLIKAAAAAARARVLLQQSNIRHADSGSVIQPRQSNKRTQQHSQSANGFSRQHRQQCSQNDDIRYIEQPPQQQQQQQHRERQQQRHWDQRRDYQPAQRRQSFRQPFNQQQQQQRPQQRTHQQQQSPQQQHPQERLAHNVKYTLGAQQDWSLPTGLAVTWLGTSSGAPTKDRNISCTLVRTPNAIYMVDCGEGSHRQAKSTGLQMHQVESIFITHLHGDHCFGIGSMLVSLCQARRAQREHQQQQQFEQQEGQKQQQQQYPPGEGPSALRLIGPPRLGELVATLLVGAGVGRRLDLPVYVTEFVVQPSDAHDWEPLPGCEPGKAFIRRLAPQRLSQDDMPAGLAARLSQTGLDWRDHPANSRKLSFFARTGLVWRIECEDAVVTAAQLQHRVPCWGYVFDELPQLQQEQMEAAEQSALAEGQQKASTSSSGGNEDQDQQDWWQWWRRHQRKLQPGRRVLVLGDTVDSRAIAPVAYGADLVSHEATFAQGMEGKAAVAQHSTAWMAGQFANAINAKALVLTHFSARYEGSADKFNARSGGSKRGGHDGHRVRSWELAQAEAEAKAAEERAVKALQREAEEFYSQGPILLAMDLFTVHVPQLK